MEISAPQLENRKRFMASSPEVSCPTGNAVVSGICYYMDGDPLDMVCRFADGNGRMGRMWHSLLLGKWEEMFFWLPIEELIQSRQKEYYDALSAADKQANSAGFVELMLEIIRDSLTEITVVGRSTVQDSDQVTVQDKTPIERILSAIGDETLSATELMERLGLSHRPTFRKNYLNPALEQKLIERTIPDKPNSKNQKYRKHKSLKKEC